MKKGKNNLFTQRTLSNIIVICTGVLLFLLLSNFTTVRQFLGWFFSIFSPFVTAIVIAYLLNMPMRFFETHLFAKYKRKRTLSIVTTYLLALLLLALLLGMILPQIVESVRTLVGNFSLYLYNLNNLVSSVGTMLNLDTDFLDTFLVSYQDLANQVVEIIRQFLPDLLNYTVQFGSGVVGVFTALIASIYMLAGKEKLLRQLRRVLYALLPRGSAHSLQRVGKLSNGVFSGFIGGKIVDSVIIGLICFVFMSVMNIISSLSGIDSLRMPFATLISVVIGVTNIIPFFGPFIGAIPSVMILLMINPWGALWFTIFIIVLQQFDGNILGPKILGNSTGLPAMWVLVAIIVFGGLFGFTGMLIGVPTTAVLYSLTGDFIERRLRHKGMNKMPGLAQNGQDGEAPTTPDSPSGDAPLPREEEATKEDEPHGE